MYAVSVDFPPNPPCRRFCMTIAFRRRRQECTNSRSCAQKRTAPTRPSTSQSSSPPPRTQTTPHRVMQMLLERKKMQVRLPARDYASLPRPYSARTQTTNYRKAMVGAVSSKTPACTPRCVCVPQPCTLGAAAHSLYHTVMPLTPMQGKVVQPPTPCCVHSHSIVLLPPLGNPSFF